MKLNAIGRASCVCVCVFAQIGAGRQRLQTLCVTNRIHFWIRRSTVPSAWH